jgi:hypothetical protein
VEHLVRFTSAEGREGFHSASDLDDALKFVERLRNNEEVGNVRLFRLQEVPIEFKAYYKVEILDGADPAPEPDPAEPESAGPAPSEERESLVPTPTPAPSEEPQLAVTPAGSDGGRKLFGRS